MCPRRSVVLAFTLGVLTLSRAPLAAETATGNGFRRELGESLGLSANPVGLQNSLELRWSRPLTSSRRALLADAHLSLGFTHSLTPSYTRLGAWAEVAPLSILEVRLGAEPAVYFGTFGSLMSFQEYGDRFDDGVRDARKSQARAGTATRFYVSPTLKMKMGPLVAVSGAELEWWRSSADGPLFYEPARDTLLKAGGDRLLTASSLLLLEQDLSDGGKLFYGLGHKLTYVFDAPFNRSQRVGIVVAREFGGRRFGLTRPRIAAHVSYYLSDPSRRRQVSAALGVSFDLTR